MTSPHIFAPVLIALAAGWLGWHVRGLRERLRHRDNTDRAGV